MRGRRPSGPQYVQQLTGSDQAKKRLRVVLETLSGTCRVQEACRQLNISEPRFHQLRTEALAAAAGRGSSPNRLAAKRRRCQRCRSSWPSSSSKWRPRRLSCARPRPAPRLPWSCRTWFKSHLRRKKKRACRTRKRTAGGMAGERTREQASAALPIRGAANRPTPTLCPAAAAAHPGADSARQRHRVVSVDAAGWLVAAANRRALAPVAAHLAALAATDGRVITVLPSVTRGCRRWWPVRARFCCILPAAPDSAVQWRHRGVDRGHEETHGAPGGLPWPNRPMDCRGRGGGTSRGKRGAALG